MIGDDRRKPGPATVGGALGEDAPWIAVLALVTLIEFGWWARCWMRGMAPAPHLLAYLGLSAAALAAALALRRLQSPRFPCPRWPVLVIAALLIAIGAALFLPLKYAIPREIPFWLDEPLASAERALFGADPWRIADRLFGWALVPVDRVYGLWLPVQTLALFSVVLAPGGPAKSRTLIAYSLAWFILGVVAAVLLASVGPIFYDRLIGGHRFAELAARLSLDAPMARRESDAMWASFASGRPGFVAGMSAMPSLHVAISFWMWLAARALKPGLATAALAYAIFMWVASVQLGWHYVSDGLAGAVGMAAIWWLSGKVAVAAGAAFDLPESDGGVTSAA